MESINKIKSPLVKFYQPDSTPNPEDTPNHEIALKNLCSGVLAGAKDRTILFAAKTAEQDLDQNGFQRKKYVKKKITCFTEEMDKKLMTLVKTFGESSWNRVSKIMNRSEIKCHKRYLALSNKEHMVSAPWSVEEDEKLRSLIIENGAKNWTKVAN